MVKGIALIVSLVGATLAHGEVSSPISNYERLKSLTSVQKIAFGSCNNQYHHQPLWKDLLREAPDLFIWGGDNIYADTTDAQKIGEAYALQNANADYAFFKSMVPIIGTWDDHDFAFNNAIGNYRDKALSQAHFLNFIEEPAFSPRRHGEGIYTSYEFGPEEKKIKIILLDNRYFKGLDAEAPMLGQAQWKWLEAELKESTASLHFIMTGLSVFSPKLPFSEEWADHPVELNRFLRLVKETKPKGLVILSGDKHFSSIFQRYGHLEFMSSGMTHTLSKGIRSFVGRKYPNAFFGLNYGLIEITWEETTPLLTMAIRNREGRSIHQKKFRWEKVSWQEL